MADPAVRIALLARAGTARDQLRRALLEAGAQIVSEGDPSELDPDQVSAQSPTVFLVSLEPAIEASLDRFDDLFGQHGVEVMYDDAEVTSKLDGWDLNRWARHLASKLLGTEGLPPAPGGSDSVPEAQLRLAPGLPPTPAELMDHARLEDYTAESSELAGWVPSSPSLADSSGTSDAAGPESPSSISWKQSADSGDQDEFNLDTDLGIDLDLSELDFATLGEGDSGEARTAVPESDSSTTAGLEMGESLRFSSFEKAGGDSDMGDLDADVAQLAAQLEAFEKSDQRSSAFDPDFSIAVEADRNASAPASAEPGRGNSQPASRISASGSGGPRFDFSDLSLAPVDGAPPEVSSEPIEVKFVASSSPQDLGLMTKTGAVLILAGMGGPDAVRQLLSSLPESLRVPVLLYQHLEVGKHERLVEQMAKISKLPVVLALEGASPESGKVTMLPAGMTAVDSGRSITFVAGSLSRLISALPPRESMIIVLSGADPELVPMLLAAKDAGGTLLGQDPEVCFDAVAAEAIRREGAAVYPALGLARQIADRWPN
jgi:chemotaxis response regulator CheB